MPVTPVAGVPPQSVFVNFERTMETSPAFFSSAPATPKRNFYTENGQIILAAIVVIMLIILMFVDTVGKFNSGFFF